MTKKPRVVIQVEGGVAEVIDGNAVADIHIIDLDNFEERDEDELFDDAGNLLGMLTRDELEIVIDAMLEIISNKSDRDDVSETDEY